MILETQRLAVLWIAASDGAMGFLGRECAQAAREEVISTLFTFEDHRLRHKSWSLVSCKFTKLKARLNDDDDQFPEYPRYDRCRSPDLDSGPQTIPTRAFRSTNMLQVEPDCLCHPAPIILVQSIRDEMSNSLKKTLRH